MLLDLKKGIIYGPVKSRRLGRSLGINILPGTQKLCAFDCVYCQYGWTEDLRAKPEYDARLPEVKEVRKALEDALACMDSPPSYITFSGNGEPTLHPDFSFIVDEVISVRNTRAPEASTAILSNSATVMDSATRDALSKLDYRIMKLDCGAPHIFNRYNRPCPGVTLENITKGLAALPEVIIQTLVASGANGNYNLGNIRNWIKRLQRIKPLFVQLYTLDRGVPARNLIPTSPNKLHKIKHHVFEDGISIYVY